jgi:3-phenylpropionate/cinnamic acid dioxygenase small subunit
VATLLDASEGDKILTLLSRSSRLLDGRQFQEWSETFAEDGRFNAREGRAVILETITGGSLAAQPNLKRRHTVVNTEIVLDGGRATCISDLIMYEKIDAESEWTIKVGRYDDQVVRQANGEWLFATRKLQWVS